MKLTRLAEFRATTRKVEQLRSHLGLSIPCAALIVGFKDATGYIKVHDSPDLDINWTHLIPHYNFALRFMIFMHHSGADHKSTRAVETERNHYASITFKDLGVPAYPSLTLREPPSALQQYEPLLQQRIDFAESEADAKAADERLKFITGLLARSRRT
ncbi:hypothetical protein [Candidatus Macondimonas diazotrophica]|jgi:hypothetical protein|uniref:Uncharacterized protein n=1 Tax=Candidatus Macondimonas diazotrophica TaxID=2305248 RepID=A0A4Z0F717_9GAMM|nr:hypothetical protein [Candidatus Macondimonas diazotrophica]TFZ81159.1 hypothetical protein E4680_13565 [Candidatus Macondimonas diazotrophica]